MTFPFTKPIKFQLKLQGKFYRRLSRFTYVNLNGINDFPITGSKQSAILDGPATLMGKEGQLMINQNVLAIGPVQGGILKAIHAVAKHHAKHHASR